MSERITVAGHASFRKLGAGAGGVLLNLKTTAYFRVNEFGAAVLQVVEPGVTFAELVATLRARLVDPPADLDASVREFLEELTKRDLVTIERSAEP